jgi:putative transposase
MWPAAYPGLIIESPRKVKSNRRSISGFYPCSQRLGGKFLPWESNLEKKALIYLDFDPGVKQLDAQLTAVVIQGGKQFHPDFLVRTKSHRYLIEVKYEFELIKDEDEILIKKFERIKKECDSCGYEYVFITDSTIEDKTVRVLQEIRDFAKGESKFDVRERVTDAVRKMGNECKLGELLQNWAEQVDDWSKLHELSKLILEGHLWIKSCPTESHLDCIITLPNDDDVPPNFHDIAIPFDRLVRRIEFHPYRLLLNAKKCKLENKLLSIAGEQYDVLSEEPRSESLVRCKRTGEIYRIDLSNDNMLIGISRDEKTNFDLWIYLELLKKEKPVLYEKFKARKTVIPPLAEKAHVNGQEIEDASISLGESARNVWRLIHEFKKARDFGLLPREWARGGPGKSRLSAKILSRLEQTVQELYLTNQRVSKIAVYEKMCKDAEKAEFRNEIPPSRATVYRHIDTVSPGETLLNRLGQQAFDAKFGLTGGQFQDGKYPLQTVEIDWTKLDLIAVDEETGRPLGRPYLLIGIDAYSRCIWAYYLSFDRPDAESVGLLVNMGALKKDDLLKKYQLDPFVWPYGIPDQVQSDNGLELIAESVEIGYSIHNIIPVRRPVMKPRYGPHVERLVQTINTKLIERLHGKTFNSIAERRKGQYEPERFAEITLPQLNRLILQFIKEYHENWHSSLRMAPLEKWTQGIESTLHSPREPVDPARFRLDFLPLVREGRGIQNDGIHIDEICYRSKDLFQLPRENQGRPIKYRVKRNPQDLRFVWLINDREGNMNYLELRADDRIDRAISLREWRTYLDSSAESRRGRRPTFSAAFEFNHKMDRAAMMCDSQNKPLSGSRRVHRNSESTRYNQEQREHFDQRIDDDEADNSILSPSTEETVSDFVPEFGEGFFERIRIEPSATVNHEEEEKRGETSHGDE